MTRLANDLSVSILTRPAVITGFNRSLLVDWWSIGRFDVKVLGIIVVPFYWILYKTDLKNSFNIYKIIQA